MAMVVPVSGKFLFWTYLLRGVGNLFVWFVNIQEEEHRSAWNKLLVRGILVLFLFYLVQSCSFHIPHDSNGERIYPLRTDGKATVNLNTEERPISGPEESLFEIQNGKQMRELNDGKVVVLPVAFSEAFFYPIEPGTCQLVKKGQTVRFASHTPPVFVVGMRAVTYRTTGNTIKSTASWKEFVDDWDTITIDSDGYKKFVSGTQKRENGFICI